MATAPKVVRMQSEQEPKGSPLTPEMREFIDRAVVPVLVKKFLREKSLEVVREQAENLETK